MAERRRARGAPDTPPDEGPPQPGEEGPSFEQALQQLESIVDRLEEGELELEDALTAFEAGVKLTRRCAGQLEDAERRIEVLVREGEKWIARPFEDAEETEG